MKIPSHFPSALINEVARKTIIHTHFLWWDTQRSRRERITILFWNISTQMKFNCDSARPSNFNATLAHICTKSQTHLIFWNCCKLASLREKRKMWKIDSKVFKTSEGGKQRENKTKSDKEGRFSWFSCVMQKSKGKKEEKLIFVMFCER